MAVLSAPARAQGVAGEVPLADVLEILVVDRDLLAIDAAGGGQTVARLRLHETVLWKGARGKVGVIITDQRMPGMNGTELLAKICLDHPNVVRLMMTGYADIDSVIEAINRGQVFRYVSKPWNPLELEAVIRQAVEHFDLFDERNRLLELLCEEGVAT